MSIIDLSCGTNSTFIIKNDGTLWSCGSNNAYRTAQGTNTDNTYLFTQIGSATNWAHVSASNDHGMALASDGTVWSWGNNTNGRTGQNTGSGNTTTPTQIGSDTDWGAISCGNNHSLFLKTDGTLWSCGSDASGQAGQGGGSDLLVPTQVGTDTDWIAISAGNVWSAALKSGFTLYTFGNNSVFRTGLGTDTGNTTTPTQVGIDTNWESIAASSDGGFAIKSTGAMYSWGNNTNGITAQNTSSGTTDNPTQIGSDTDWNILCRYNSSVSTGFAIKDNGTLYGWGLNTSGQVGIGTVQTGPLVPTQIGTDTDWLLISSGSSFSLGAKTP